MVQVLKRRFPDSQVDFLAIPETYDVLRGHPDISHVVVYDKHGKHNSLTAFLDLRAGLKKRRYDLLICPHRSLRSALLASGTKAEVRIGFDRSALKRSFTDIKPWEFGVHEIDRNLSLLEPLGIVENREEPRLYPDEVSREAAEKLLSSHGVTGSYAVVAPGTVWETKRYPPDLMREVVKGLLARFQNVVLVGGKKDVTVAARIADVDDRVISAVGELEFMASAEIIRRASLMVANDSAPVHVASAFGTPAVAIFGPTVKDFGFYPYHENSRVVEIEGLSCRPCSIHGGKSCPIGTLECMKKIAPERVVAVGFDLLAEQTNTESEND